MNARHALIAAGLLLAVAGCQKSPSVNPAAPGCLQYQMGMVTLEGMASTREITAPGKDRRSALVLTLDAPICVAARSGNEAQFPAHQNVTEVELVPQSDFTAAYSLAGQRVSAHGNLAPMSGDGAAAPVGVVLRTLKPAQ